MFFLILISLISYLIGSIPIGYLVCQSAKKIDIRQYGSGNIGFTNVHRIIGLKYGIWVLILDASRGPILFITTSLLLGRNLTNLEFSLIGFSTIIGNVLPIWLSFRGGKGIATAAGVILFIIPQVFGISLAVWALLVLTTKLVSLGSLAATISLLAYYLITIPQPWLENLPLTIFLIVLALIVLLTHKKNIIRLWQGRENKLGESKT